jgi:Tfp pilus assembly protein PilO
MAAIEAYTVQLNDIQQKALKIDKEIEEIRALKAAQEKDAERLNVFLGFIPEKLSNFEMMRTLSNEAKAVGVNINSIKDSGQTSGKTGEFYEEIGVDISLEGSFAQLLLFLSNLTRLNQIVTLNTLEIRGGGAVDAPLSMAAQIRGYRYVANKTPGKPAK